MHFERYVAIGDSTSEGLDDPDGQGGYRGWSNRLAERIAAQQGSLLYANSLGHARIADALAYHLGLPGTDMAWAEPLPERPRPTPLERVRAELLWGWRYLLPWTWRHLRGRSSGDGRSAKRPELMPV